MYKFITKVLLGVILVLLHSYVIGQPDPGSNCGDTKLLISNFVNNKQSKSWDLIENDADKLHADICPCEMAPILYSISRMHVIFPNSQALQGISPDDFVTSHEIKMSEQIKILKNCNEKNYVALINAMMHQNFDEEISNTAKELKKKIVRTQK